MAEVLKNEEMGKLAVKLKKRSEVEIEKAYVSLKEKGYAQAVGVDRMDAGTHTTHHDELSPWSFTKGQKSLDRNGKRTALLEVYFIDTSIKMILEHLKRPFDLCFLVC